jgi:hypothetical protein
MPRTAPGSSFFSHAPLNQSAQGSRSVSLNSVPLIYAGRQMAAARPQAQPRTPAAGPPTVTHHEVALLQARVEHLHGLQVPVAAHAQRAVVLAHGAGLQLADVDELKLEDVLGAAL